MVDGKWAEGNGAANPFPIAHLPALVPPPLSLYIHIPWCVRKCPYCDFNSHAVGGELPEEQYVAALLRDLEMALPQVWGRKVVSIFIGGGTPSLLSPRALDTLLSGVRAMLPVEAGAEVTLEANPGTAEAGKFAGFRDAGVTRLSLGIQSFDSRHLRALGRIHDAGETHRAAEMALKRFDNVNFDLMYGLPGQSLDEALADLRAAMAHGPTHLSAYHLTLEPNTLFYAQPPALPDDDLCATMQEAIEAELAGAGFEHYETSAFARKNRRCRHNLNYWTYGDYLGLGAGAHGKLTFHDRIVRQVRPRAPHDYLAAVAAGLAAEEHAVALPERAFEFMMNALRLTKGFDPRLFTPATGLPLAAIDDALREAEQRGLLERLDNAIRPTLLGQRFLNELLQLFLPETNET